MILKTICSPTLKWRQDDGFNRHFLAVANPPSIIDERESTGVDFLC